jgi:hypothetical protein
MNAKFDVMAFVKAETRRRNKEHAENARLACVAIDELLYAARLAKATLLANGGPTAAERDRAVKLLTKSVAKVKP